MKRWRAMLVVVVGTVVLLAACSSSSKSSTSKTTTTPAPVVSTTSSSPSTSTPSTSVAAHATLAVVTNSKLGKIIVAASGKTVYLYMPDETSTTSTVPAALKSAWPAVTASGTSTVDASLDKTKLAVDPQPDGTKQVAYNGHLLYTFQGDAAPGSASGERLGGIWFVLSPAGIKIA